MSSSDRDFHQAGYSYSGPQQPLIQQQQQLQQPQQMVTPSHSPNGNYSEKLAPQQYNQMSLKPALNVSSGYLQYQPAPTPTYNQPVLQQTPPDSSTMGQSSSNWSPYKRDGPEYVHNTQQEQQTQSMVSTEDQRFNSDRMVLNRTNSAPVFMSNTVSYNNTYQSPSDVCSNRNFIVPQQLYGQQAPQLAEKRDFPSEHSTQRPFTPQPQETSPYRVSWSIAYPQHQFNGMPTANEYSRDQRFIQPPPPHEYYHQQPYLQQRFQVYPEQNYSYNPAMPFQVLQQYHPMDMRHQGYPVCGSNNMGYFSMAAQSGPIPASKPKISTDEKTGEELITFSYSKQKVIREFTVRVPLEKFDTSSLTDEFKKNNCVYPKAIVPFEQYKGNRFKYETECNEMGWTLAWFNEDIRDHRGLIQRAVDSWRNTRPDKSIRSRRARRDID